MACITHPAHTSSEHNKDPELLGNRDKTALCISQAMESMRKPQLSSFMHCDNAPLEEKYLLHSLARSPKSSLQGGRYARKKSLLNTCVLYGDPRVEEAMGGLHVEGAVAIFGGPGGCRLGPFDGLRGSVLAVHPGNAAVSYIYTCSGLGCCEASSGRREAR